MHIGLSFCSENIQIALILSNGRPVFPNGIYPTTRSRLMPMFYLGLPYIDPFLVYVMPCITCIIGREAQEKIDIL